jgi:hypothetical protein
MPYYLVSFILSDNYFNATHEVREALTKQEIEHGQELFKVGIWRHAYATAGDIKTHTWAIYETASEAELAAYLEEYPMAKAAMYTRVVHEVTTVDPPRIVGLLFKVLRAAGLYRPWRPELVASPVAALKA